MQKNIILAEYIDRAVNVGAKTRYYDYDGNGNVTTEREGGPASTVMGEGHRLYEEGELYYTDYGFGLVRPGSGAVEGAYEREYRWDERNRMTESHDGAYSMHYRYGADGERAIKYNGTTGRETVYFNRLWQMNNTAAEWEQSKHIYVGETRIGTKNNSEGNENTRAEEERTYYYHGDHLGSAQVVTNHAGQVHERLEYTPYGELWIDRRDSGGERTPYRFTGKELDEETGLYYYGARYLDPKASRWMSADPAMGEYIPVAPISDEARRRNGSLPGMGGVFNLVNLHVYHYAGNNPVKYIDPDGEIVRPAPAQYIMQNYPGEIPAGNGLMQESGCAVALAADIAYDAGATGVTPNTIIGNENNFNERGLIWNNALSGTNVVTGSRVDGQLSIARYNELDASPTEYYLVD